VGALGVGAGHGGPLLYGALIFGSPDLLAALQRQRFLSLAIGGLAYACLHAGYFAGTVRPTILPEARPLYALLSAINVMAWLFAIVGFAHRHLTRRPAFLSEATEAVYPFYLIHQTVTVIAVWGLLRAGVPPLAGFVAAVGATFAGTWLIYAGLVRPWRWIRPLFGMKPAPPGERRSLPRRAAGL